MEGETIPPEQRISSSSARKISFVRGSTKRVVRVESTDVEARARELLAMAAHDLRSPLSALKLKAHKIVKRWQAGEDPLGVEWAEVIFAMLRRADDAFSLIDDVLALERLRQDDRRGEGQAAIDVEKVVEDAIAHQSDVLDRARCQVTVVRHKSLDQARGKWDRGDLLRILWNLLRNVAKHAPGAPVQITLTRRRGNKLGIVFADRGPGISAPSEQPRAPEIDDADPEKASHGLGIWIVYRSVERLGGRLKVRNKPGLGVAFDIELPGLQT